MKRIIVLLLLAAPGLANAQALRSLRTVPVPTPPTLSTYVQNPQALVALGKAWFWDLQVGSDGRTACATCHFHAGADHRIQNQLVDPFNPFPLNRTLRAEDFPFHRVADPANRGSAVLADASYRAGSAGLFQRLFVDILPGLATEMGLEPVEPAGFVMGGLQLRRVTRRNTPTVFDAVFNVRNFWDGRASRIFNGRTPFGDADIQPSVLVHRDGVVVRETARLDNASLASQAVGPPMDGLEMSYDGRSWSKMGKKLLALSPLAYQAVAPDDSVLGPLASKEQRGFGVAMTYFDLVRAAFRPEYWNSGQLFDSQGNVLESWAALPGRTDEFSQAEINFPLFWGLALQAYQSTLISTDTRYDRFADGDPSALSPTEQEGLNLFRTGGGRCQGCHALPESTTASFTSLIGRDGGGTPRGFFRTGVRPIQEDEGFANGNFKASGLRNIELTGPYFHNGSQATLEQVMEFYSRGGDFGGLRVLNLGVAQRQSLVQFMRALTDDRVRFERAPFDHPELCVPDGHVEIAPGVLQAADDRSAVSRWIGIPAVGAAGESVPLQTFDELLRGVGADGSRAHSMVAPCAIPLP